MSISKFSAVILPLAVAAAASAQTKPGAVASGSSTAFEKVPAKASVLLTMRLPDATVGDAYRQKVGETKDIPNGLPPGLELRKGWLQGVPTTAGSWTFKLDTGDPRARSLIVEHSITVRPAPTMAP